MPRRYVRTHRNKGRCHANARLPRPHRPLIKYLSLCQPNVVFRRSLAAKEEKTENSSKKEDKSNIASATADVKVENVNADSGAMAVTVDNVKDEKEKKDSSGKEAKVSTADVKVENVNADSGAQAVTVGNVKDEKEEKDSSSKEAKVSTLKADSSDKDVKDSNVNANIVDNDVNVTVSSNVTVGSNVMADSSVKNEKGSNEKDEKGTSRLGALKDNNIGDSLNNVLHIPKKKKGSADTRHRHDARGKELACQHVFIFH
jgi:hypothetical protein